MRELGFPGFLLVYIDRAGNALGIYGTTAHVDYPNKTDCKEANANQSDSSKLTGPCSFHFFSFLICMSFIRITDMNTHIMLYIISRLPLNMKSENYPAYLLLATSDDRNDDLD